MKRLCILFVFALGASLAPAQTPVQAPFKECSTEKVNSDCTVTIDRLYPVSLPIIQLRRGQSLTVKVAHPLQFETLSLDPQSAQAIAGTDQTTGLLTALIPYAKSFVAESRLTPPPPPPPPPVRIEDLTPAQRALKKVDDDLAALAAKIQAVGDFVQNGLFGIYLQLQQILSPIPRPLVAPPQTDPNGLPAGTPNPWTDYPHWRQLLLCELAGDCDQVSNPPVKNVLDTLTRLKLPTVAADGTSTWTDTTLFTESFDTRLAQTKTDIKALSPTDQLDYTNKLNALTRREANLTAYSTLLGAAGLPKDLTSYLVNIRLVQTPGITDPQPLGDIYDPKCPPKTPHCPRIPLGTQVAFAVNAVNQIGVLPASAPSASQKKAVATITVLYADPIFEVSTGIFFSTLPNRSFANQTQVVQNAGSAATQGNIFVGQTIARPTIVPFAAANWRLHHDFLWPDSRRAAVYLTAGAGLNPYNTTAEFVAGPSLSWRSLMFSALFHYGHDVRLTQGESVGEVWCNQTAKTCSPSPPSPSTEKYWTPAFAFGIGIRVPTLFGGTGR